MNKCFTSVIQGVNFKAVPVVNNGFLAMRVLCLFFLWVVSTCPTQAVSPSSHRLLRVITNWVGKHIQDYTFTGLWTQTKPIFFSNAQFSTEICPLQIKYIGFPRLWFSSTYLFVASKRSWLRSTERTGMTLPIVGESRKKENSFAIYSTAHDTPTFFRVFQSYKTYSFSPLLRLVHENTGRWEK